MPIDSEIPLAAHGLGQLVNPMELYQHAQQAQLQRQAIQSNQALEEERRQRVADEQRKRAEADRYNALLASSADMQPEDFAKLVQQKAPEHYQAVRAAIDASNEKAAIAKEHASQTALHQQNYIAHLADQIDQSDYDPVVLNMALNHAVTQFPEWKPQADQLRQIAAAGGKDALKSAIRPMITSETMHTRAETANAVAELPGKQATSAIQQQVAAGTVGGMTPEQQAQKTARDMTNKVAQGSLAVSQGNLNLATKREAREQAKDDLLTGSGVGPDGKPLPENPVARAIAEYRVPPPAARAMASGPGQALMRQVAAINPGFDATEFPNRAKTRVMFTTGTQGQKINAMNTAIGHLDQLSAAVSDLGNTDIQIVNRAKNFIATQFGGTSVTNFEAIKDALAGEISNVLSGSGATVSGIKDAQEHIKAAASPAQLAGYINTQIPILGSKLSSYDYQYHQAMGEKDPFSALSPDAKAILTKRGFDPAHPTIAGAGATDAKAAAPAGTVKMRTPDGRVLNIPADKVDEALARGARKVGG